MTKKILVCLSLCLVCLGLAGCGKTINDVVRENMSELTQDFYYAENDDFVATLSVGEREEEYFYDGKKTDSVQFALLTLSFKEYLNEKIIKVQVASGDTSKIVEMEYNDLSGTFMADIVNEIEIGESVFVNFDGNVVELEKTSSNFTIQSNEAINIACENLQTELEELKSFSHFNGECYLRVLNQKENKFDDFYWCFTCIDNEGGNFSVIISTSDGSVLAKSE